MEIFLFLNPNFQDLEKSTVVKDASSVYTFSYNRFLRLITSEKAGPKTDVPVLQHLCIY